jgi:hypothetical protein
MLYLITFLFTFVIGRIFGNKEFAFALAAVFTMVAWGLLTQNWVTL